MEKPWNILYYQTEQGVCEIREFINSRKPEERQKIAAWISLLEEKGPQVRSQKHRHKSHRTKSKRL